MVNVKFEYSVFDFVKRNTEEKFKNLTASIPLNEKQYVLNVQFGLRELEKEDPTEMNMVVFGGKMSFIIKDYRSILNLDNEDEYFEFIESLRSALRDQEGELDVFDIGAASNGNHNDLVLEAFLQLKYFYGQR